MINKIISNYKITELIGVGGMSKVYLAEHLHLQRRAAIKQLNKEFLRDNEIRSRFKNEAHTIARLQHPNIINFYDYFERDNSVFLIMEYFKGPNLKEYMAGIRQTVSKEDNYLNAKVHSDFIITIFNQILSALTQAHNMGIVHRDLKPSNILINPDTKQIKILDFGIAKIINSNDLGLTKPGSRMGTILYMSPEQAKGLLIDQRTDLFVLGIILNELLSFKHPIEKITTEFEIYEQIVNKPIKLPEIKWNDPLLSGPFYSGPVRRVNIKLPVINLIKKACEKNPDIRFRSASEFQDALYKSIEPDHNIYQSIHQTTIKRDKISSEKKSLSEKEATIASHQERMFAAILDNIFPLIYLIIFLFAYDQSGKTYGSLHHYLKLGFKYREQVDFLPAFISSINDQFLLTFTLRLGELKFIFSLLFIIYLFIQGILLVVKKGTLGKLAIKLEICPLRNNFRKNLVNRFTINVLLRKSVNLALLILYVVFSSMGEYYLSFGVMVLASIYYITDKLFIFKNNQCLHDMIANTKVISK